MIIEDEGSQSPIITRADREKWDSEKDEPSSDTPRSIKRSILEHLQTDLKRAELDKQLKTTTDIFKELPAYHITKKALLTKVGPPPSSPIVPAHLPSSIPFDEPSPISTGESPKESSQNQAMPSPIRRLHSKVSRIGSKAGTTPLHKSAILRQKELNAELEDVLHLWEGLIDSTECPQESELLQYLRRLDPNKVLMFGSTADDLRTFHSQLLQSIKSTNRDAAKRKNTITRLHSFFQRRQKPVPESQKKETNVKKFLDIFNDYELSDEEPTPDMEMVKLEHQVIENIGENLIDFEQLIFHQKIGEGAYSEVFAGTYHQQPVAIKRFKDFNGHKTQLIHFSREIAVLKQVEGVPRIVNMRGACLFPVSCILFEYFDCGSLDQFVVGHQHHFNFSESIRIALSVAEIVQNLHSLEPPLVHRDISMSNILLKKNEAGLWVPFLSDFGISQVLQGDIEGTSTGHPRYRPPEITLKIAALQGTGVDAYCFGSFLYELFVGEKVGHGMSDAEVCEMRIRGETLPLPISLEAGIADLITACWTFDPVKRPNFCLIIQKLKSLGNV